MGQCAGKSASRKKKGKEVFKKIPAGSPLGEFLINWDTNEGMKDLDNKIKIIRSCTEIWLKESIAEEPIYWPWYRTKERWPCVALNRYVNTQVEPCDKEIRHAKYWLEREKQKEEIKLYQVSREEEKEETKLPERRWDPLDHLPPPPPPDPLDDLPLPPSLTPPIDHLPLPPPTLYPLVPSYKVDAISVSTPTRVLKSPQQFNSSFPAPGIPSSVSPPFPYIPESAHSSTPSVLQIPSSSSSTQTPVSSTTQSVHTPVLAPKTFQNTPLYFSPILQPITQIPYSYSWNITKYSFLFIPCTPTY